MITSLTERQTNELEKRNKNLIKDPECNVEWHFLDEDRAS